MWSPAAVADNGWPEGGGGFGVPAEVGGNGCPGTIGILFDGGSMPVDE
tara:strand:- start:37 stop:180 length:144 start_codon:yes stop_codon:yes gene_type:complete